MEEAADTGKERKDREALMTLPPPVVLTILRNSIAQAGTVAHLGITEDMTGKAAGINLHMFTDALGFFAFSS